MSQAGLTDFISVLQKTGSVNTPVQSEAPMAELLPLNVHLYKEFGNDSLKHRKIEQLLKGVGAFAGPQTGILGVNKDVTGVDLGPVRIVSLYPVIAQYYNNETKFLNILKSRAPYIATDTEIRIPEEDIVTDQIPLFHPESTLPAVYQSVLSERGNTVCAQGQEIQTSYMAEELAAQSPYRRNEIQAQLQKALLRLDRSMNPTLLNAVEQTSWALSSIPSLGGFVTRSTFGAQALGGGNLTDVVIANAVNNMASIFGYDALTDLVALTNNTQISVVRNLMINRFPGENSDANRSNNMDLMARLKAQGIRDEDVQMIYRDNNQIVIPFIREMQLPAGTTILFRSSFPQLAYFKLQGSLPPWTIERPVTNLYHLTVLFSLYSLCDPLVKSRCVISGTA